MLAADGAVLSLVIRGCLGVEEDTAAALWSAETDVIDVGGIFAALGVDEEESVREDLMGWLVGAPGFYLGDAGGVVEGDGLSKAGGVGHIGAGDGLAGDLTGAIKEDEGDRVIRVVVEGDGVGSSG